MKHYIISTLAKGFPLLLIPATCYAQENVANYVKTTTMLDSMETQQAVSINYYDGIGRLSQKAESTDNASRYVHTLYQYDKKGRLTSEWLPVSIVTSGNYAPFIQYSSAAHVRSTNPTKTTAYDDLDRIISVESPGKEFANHGETQLYGTNNANELKNFAATSAGIIYTNNASAGCYDKEEHTDGDGKKYTVYKDLAGRIAVERRATNIDTYYIYDQYGQLRCVLPPAASTQFTTTGQPVSYNSDILSKYAYLYTYDEKGRCIEKKLPGCEPQHFYYDKNDRIALMDDGNLRDAGRMRFYLYDTLGRLLVQGTCKNYTGNISGISAIAKTYMPGNSCLIDKYVSSIPMEEIKPELVNVYDRYYNVNNALVLTTSEQALITFPSESTMNSSHVNFPQEKLVCSKTYQLEDPEKYTVAIFFYDEKGQLICTNSTNHMGGTDVTYTDYSFTGKPKKVLHQHTATGFPSVTESYGYSYDNCDRLSQESYSINGETPSLTNYTYDDFGRLSSNTVGGETVTYEYNVRDWPTAITSDKFKEYLWYASGNSSISVAPTKLCYNGNISGARYQYGTNTIYGFDYTYDSVNRLTKSRYGDNPSMGSGRNNAFTEVFTYDKMGNVTSLTRNGKRDDGSYGCIDDLSFTYNGNQLKYIDNNGDGTHYTGSSSYQDNSDGTNEYAYDKNGNMVKNLDKNISEIKYNVLNLPSNVTTKDNATYEVTYTYDAQGRKLRAYYRRKVLEIITPKRQQARSITLSSRFDGIIGKPVLPDTLVKDTMSTAPSEAEWLSSKITYSGNLIFTGNRVTVLNPHGYTTIDTNKTTGEQTTTRYYYLKDHLGSNRVVFRGDGTVVQQNHYYAYGGLTAESTGGTQQSYKYNGKEFDRKLGLDLYDYGARWYDPVGSSAFTTIDPLCEEDYSVSPYAYCINNPIKYIDPTGMDYWSTSDSYEINRFFQSWQSGSNIDYSGWNHTSDADFLANLSYNDKTGNYLYSYGAEENGELVCYGKVFPSLRDTKTSLNIANDVVNNFGSTLNKNAGNSTVGSNGHFYWHSGMERGFYGNQYVSTMSLAKFGRRITKVTGPIGVALSVSEIYEGYQQDKGVGYNTVHASADVGGGYVGGALGLYSFTEVGAAIGAPFGPGGMIVAGFIGATLGSIVGSYCATQITDRCYGY